MSWHYKANQKEANWLIPTIKTSTHSEIMKSENHMWFGNQEEK